jgi:DNA-binding transcriptional MerR regulator
MLQSLLAEEIKIKQCREELESSNEYHQKKRTERLKRLRESLPALTERIARAERNVREKQSRKGYRIVREYWSGYGWRYVSRGSTIVTLSQDETQLDDLIEMRGRLQEQIRQLEDHSHD